MSQAINTGSTLSFNDGKNRTSTAISTNIIIKVAGGAPIGAIQSLTVNETRTIHAVDEVGTDGHIDSVPQKSTDIEGSCKRIRFDGARVAEAFGRGFIHASSQAYPFDIVIMDRARSATVDQITTIIKNVWIKNIQVEYSATDWVIAETMSWQAEHIYSFRSGNVDIPAATGGIRPITHSIITQEQLADRGAGGRRGSLDASGLIDLGGTGDLF